MQLLISPELDLILCQKIINQNSGRETCLMSDASQFDELIMRK